ncbi:MAG: cytochrome c [Candidatus Tectomicrobia bacterium]|uniref:Cytochrome c n=1 Tax=Tectimicrobiota bacterium TaxID=2528274 RepID=A0A932HXH5_UNCTE|nr:cytochrome c [Candidatus Tectomicrobia bacterium]
MVGKVRAALLGAAAILVAASLMGGWSALEAAQEQKDSKAVAGRKKLMQGNAKAMKALNGALKAGEYPKVVMLASEIGENALGIGEAFEKKDLAGKTTALPKIWEEKAKFDRIASKMLNDSREVVEAARTKDKQKTEAAVKAMGSNCAACHKEFRQPPKKKS